MNRCVQWRIGVLVTAIAAIAGLTLWGVQTSWSRLRHLELRLTSGQLESFRLAEEFQQRLATLSNMLLHFSARRDAADLERFEQTSRSLDLWIDEQTFKIATDQERKVLNDLNIAFNDYLEAAHQVLTHGQPVTASAQTFTPR